MHLDDKAYGFVYDQLEAVVAGVFQHEAGDVVLRPGLCIAGDGEEFDGLQVIHRQIFLGAFADIFLNLAHNVFGIHEHPEVMVLKCRTFVAADGFARPTILPDEHCIILNDHAVAFTVHIVLHGFQNPSRD